MQEAPFRTLLSGRDKRISNSTCVSRKQSTGTLKSKSVLRSRATSVGTQHQAVAEEGLPVVGMCFAVPFKKKRGDTEGAEISNPPESAKKPLMMTANQQKQQQSAGPRPRHLRRCELSVGGKKEPSSPRPPPPPAAETGRGASWAHGSLDTGQRAVAARRDRGGCGRSDFSCVSGPVVTTGRG